jgi:hypothetical protein
MSRFFPLLFAFAVLSPGCVPVTEPVGDIDKAEPDKVLLGSWEFDNSRGITRIKVEMPPEVKGNPKGLMLMYFPDFQSDTPVWFFVTTIGREKYGNLCWDRKYKDATARFDKEGEYAKWAESPTRRYNIFRYAGTKTDLAINFGSEAAVKALMKDAKIETDAQGYYKTPAGWLAGYLEKNGRLTLFPTEESTSLMKAK